MNQIDQMKKIMTRKYFYEVLEKVARMGVKHEEREAAFLEIVEEAGRLTGEVKSRLKRRNCKKPYFKPF